MNTLLFRYMLTLALITCAGNVVMARIAVSTYCIAIAADHDEDKLILAERFDDFARTANLSIDRSHPMVRSYTPEEVASPIEGSALIELEMMGPLGSILTYTPLRESPPSELLEQLKRFVADSIVGAYAYEVTQCDDIEGFTAPVLHF